MNFKKIEKKWQKVWEKQDWYRAVDFDKKRKKLYILVEFPYISGSGLHIGHAFTMTGADVYARKKRMEGLNVLFPMGWDAFGLPTENYAIKTGINPKITTKKSINVFRRQIKRMALSCDWQREVGTTDPDYYKWTQWIFIQLFKQGLAYKEKKPINWCPACKTGLANEEVVSGKCERCGAKVSKKDLNQWIVKITDYADRLLDGLEKTAFIEKVKAAQINWIGRKKWIDITYPIKGTKETIIVSTTRPDTNFGATFIVVAPEHSIVAMLLSSKFKVQSSKFKEIKKYVEQAKNKSELERIAEGKTKTGVFTGLYAVNQLNGCKMPIYIADFVLMTVGTGAVVGVPGHDLRDFEFAQEFGLEVIRVVVGADEDKTKITKKEQVQEQEGTMINSEFLDGMDIHQATKKMMDYLEKKGWGKRAIRYHLRDWIFSRQHYWGEPIPMIDCQKCGWQPVPEDQLPVELPDVERYEPTGTGESPLAKIEDWIKTKCPKCGGQAKRETDTMPNWAGSDWYFLRYIDPDNDSCLAEMKKLEYWLPVDVYIGGDEHNTLHLLYSRFIYQFLWDIGAVPKKYPEPYYKRLSHGVILGQDGTRMSKSRGNMINPDDIWQKHGVDVLRTYSMFMGPFEGTMAWNDNALKGVRKFLEKFERLIKKSVKGTPGVAVTKIHQLIKKVSNDLDNCRFNTAIAAMMKFLNEVERTLKTPPVKSILSIEDKKILIKLIAPFAPYLAEELWEHLGEKESVHWASWPKADPKYLVEDEIEIVVQINGKLRGTIKIKNQKSKIKSEVEKLAKKNPQITKYLKGRQILKTIFVPSKLVNFVVK